MKEKYPEHDSTFFMGSIGEILSWVAIVVLLETETAVQGALTNF